MMEDRKVRYLIVGGGAAAAQAAVGIREHDPDGSVTIIARENRLPYDRPPLSKALLLGRTTPEDAESKDPSFYKDKNVEVLTGREATSIDRGARRVELDDGRGIEYEKLLIATGATPKRPPIAGTELDGVFFLRTVDDSLAIREALDSAKTAAFAGAGYIGMEVASGAISKGVNVTIVDPGEHPWSNFASSASGNFLKHTFEKHGATFLMNDEVASIAASGGKKTVKTKSGKEILADVVVIGTGVNLDLQLAKKAGFEIDDKHGVVADKFLQTSDPNAFVAGDIAAFDDVVLGKRWHAEHYLNAKWTGLAAGRNMAGANQPFDKVAYFFSDMLDLHMILRGDPQGGKAAKVLGNIEAGEYVELYARPDGTLAMGMAFSHEEPKLDPISDKLEELIRAKAKVDGLDESTFGLDQDQGLG